MSNVLFALCLIDVIPMFIEHGSGEKIGIDRFLSDALFATWFAFLTAWVLGMIVGWVSSAAKKDGKVVQFLLAIPCVVGVIHFLVWPFALMIT